MGDRDGMDDRGGRGVGAVGAVSVVGTVAAVEDDRGCRAGGSSRRRQGRRQQ